METVTLFALYMTSIGRSCQCVKLRSGARHPIPVPLREQSLQYFAGGQVWTAVFVHWGLDDALNLV